MFLIISVGNVMSSSTWQWGEGHGAQVGKEMITVFPDKGWEMKTRFFLHLFFRRAFPQTEVMFSPKQCES